MYFDIYERDRDRESEQAIELIYWFNPQMLTMAWAGLVPMPGAGWQSPNYLSHPLQTPRMYINETLESGPRVRCLNQAL